MFFSRRNRVYKAKIPGMENEAFTVIKDFISKEDCARELNALITLNNSGSPVPRLLYHRDKRLYMQYIDGECMVDIIRQSPDEKIMLLGNCLESLYNGLKAGYPGKSMILGDMNLRNFIFSSRKNRIYRVDLESVKEGCIERDIGELCAFCMSYDPAFTRDKTELAHGIFRCYTVRFGLSRTKAINSILSGLRDIKDRRGIIIPPLIYSSISGW